MDIHGKTVFITGAAQGMGQGLAIEFARRGCSVIGCDLTKKRQSETQALVKAAGSDYIALAADLSDVDTAIAVTQKAAQTKTAKGIGFDILINNAGILTTGPYDERAFSRWLKTIEINLIGVMAVAHTALPHLKTRPHAHIVNMASIAGVVGAPGMAAYTASKHGVSGFTASLVHELSGTHVGVSAIHPTLVSTTMTDGVNAQAGAPMITPETVIKAIIKAIEKSKPKVFVPGYLRWSLDIGSRLFPRLTHFIIQHDKNAYSMQNADKALPKGIKH